MCDMGEGYTFFSACAMPVLLPPTMQTSTPCPLYPRRSIHHTTLHFCIPLCMSLFSSSPLPPSQKPDMPYLFALACTAHCACTLPIYPSTTRLNLPALFFIIHRPVLRCTCAIFSSWPVALLGSHSVSPLSILPPAPCLCAIPIPTLLLLPTICICI